jgi:exosortase/archaeosortase family protein
VSAAHRRAGRRWAPSATARRRHAFVVELLVAVGICLAGYFYAAPWFRLLEAEWAVAVLHLIGIRDVSDVLPEHILIFRGPGDTLAGEITTSCSSLLTVVGLTALTVAVMRDRRMHAVLGLSVAVVAVLVANNVRLVLSALAGLWWGSPAMTLFHDWVGTIWALVATLLGFLLMVWVALPAAQRAEQDVAGRHTARRPTSWARPGLGYRADQVEAPLGSRRSGTALVHRYLLPRRVSRRMAARREAGRIDYRIGHLHPDERIDTVRRLVADGLGAHTASLLAVATYDDDTRVLDALAEAVAARQWEPVVNDRVAGLRLWARGWLLSRRVATAGTAKDAAPAERPAPAARPAVPPSPADDGPQDDDTRLIRTPRPRPPRHRNASPARPPRRPAPRSFARPVPGSASPSEDLR